MAENPFHDGGTYGGLTPQGYAASRTQQLLAASLLPTHPFFSANAMVAMEASRMHFSANTLLAQLQQQADATTGAPSGLHFPFLTPNHQSICAVPNSNVQNDAVNEAADNNTTCTEEKPPTKNPT
jgi:hypothetical protein